MQLELPSNETLAILCGNLVQGQPLAIGYQPKNGGRLLKFAAECYTRGGAIQLLVMFDGNADADTKHNADLAAAVFVKKYGRQLAEDCIWVYEDRINPAPRQAAYFFEVVQKGDMLSRRPLGVLPRTLFHGLVDGTADRQVPDVIKEMMKSDNRTFLSEWFDGNAVP